MPRNCRQTLRIAPVAVVLAVAITLLAPVATAHALYVYVSSSGILSVTDLAAEANVVTIAPAGGTSYTVTDGTTPPISMDLQTSTPDPDCVVVGNTATCSNVTFPSYPISVELGDGNDQLTATSVGIAISASGSGGNDVLHTGTGDDILYDGDGSDSYDGDAGTDRMSVGPNEAGETTAITDTNFLHTGGGANEVDSHTSMDTVVPSVLTAAGGTINASAYTGGGLLMFGSPGPDTFIGTLNQDQIFPSGGNDTIDCGAHTVDTLSVVADVAANFVLTDTGVTGEGTDSHSNCEVLHVRSSAVADTIDASALTTLGDKRLWVQAGSGDDRVVLSGAAAVGDSVDGELGTDTLAVTVSGDTDLTLTDTTLAGAGSDTLDEFEAAELTGGTGDNALDASGFTAGPVTLVGGAGNDALTGGTGADSLTPGAGIDTVTGGGGSDRLVGGGAGTMTLTNASFVTSDGTDGLTTVETATLTGSAGADTISASGFTLGAVAIDAGDGADSVSGGALGVVDALDGGLGTDTLAETRTGNVTLTNAQVAYSAGATDTLAGFERAALTGDAGPNQLDTTGFTAGLVTLAGLGGSDRFTRAGDTTDDAFDGGLGNDTVIVTGAGGFTVTSAQVVGAGTDSITGVEEVDATAGAGDDTLDARTYTGGSVRLTGGSGNDTLLGSAGSDVLDGGAGTGDSVVLAADANMTLSNSQLTGAGTDTLFNTERARLTGGAAANVIDAGAFTGSDVAIDAGAGADTISGSVGADTITPGTGADSVAGGGGTDTLVAGGDADIAVTAVALSIGGENDTFLAIEALQLTAGASANAIDLDAATVAVTLDAGDGDDTVNAGSATADTLAGGTGTDTLVLEGESPSITLGDTQVTHLGATDSLSGFDAARVAPGIATTLLDANGFSGPITVTASTAATTITTGAGNDTISGGTGGDAINGGAGTDTLVETLDANMTLSDGELDSGGVVDTLGGVELATITGGDSANVLNASSFTGAATLTGGAGNDTLTGGAGFDTLDGGSGTDRVSQSANANMTLTNTSLTGRGTDTLNSIEAATLTGGPGANQLTAASFSLGAVTLTGGSGADRLTGGKKGDTLSGGAGNDRLTGGAGADTLSAGAGTDRIAASDKRKDTKVDCGAGKRDVAVIDRAKDRKVTGCERVTRR